MLYGNELAATLNKICKKATTRIWIVVPFIGSWKDVQRIIGISWRTNVDIDIKLLTDIRNSKYISKETFKIFQKQGEVKTLPGLHAKLYIADDKVLMTSANLSGTAFKKRYEVGLLRNYNKSIDKLFHGWWDKAGYIDDAWKPISTGRKGGGSDEPFEESGLRDIWDLPEASIRLRVFKKYSHSLNQYRIFKDYYLKYGGRIWKSISIWHEIDAFLNYMFHEHPDTPSNEYIKEPPRSLSKNQIISEIRYYKRQYKNWLTPKEKKWRSQRIINIQRLLSKSSLQKLNRKKIINVANQIHALNSHNLNYYSFIKTSNNATATVKKVWMDLIHGSDPLEERMERCNNALFRFGKSCIQELISFYYPDKYPVINRNPNAGLRFFGFDVKVY